MDDDKMGSKIDSAMTETHEMKVEVSRFPQEKCHLEVGKLLLVEEREYDLG